MVFMVTSTFALVAATVAIHVAGLAALLQRYLPGSALSRMSFLRLVWLLAGVAWALILIHAAEIALWALFYLVQGCFPDLQSALYFSGATYTTVGYGDLVLPAPWYLLGPLEGLVGILMCGLSTAVFFAFVSRIYGAKHREQLGDKSP
jgi:hypothetical protein